MIFLNSVFIHLSLCYVFFLEVSKIRVYSTSPQNESLNFEIIRDGVYDEKGLIKLFTFLLLFSLAKVDKTSVSKRPLRQIWTALGQLHILIVDLFILCCPTTIQDFLLNMIQSPSVLF